MGAQTKIMVIEVEREQFIKADVTRLPHIHGEK